MVKLGMKKLKPIFLAVVAIWGFALLINVIISSFGTSEETELGATIVAEEPLAASAHAVTQPAQGNTSNLTCYPYRPIVDGDQNALNLSGSACIGYFNAYAIATNSGNAAVLRQLNDPQVQLFTENAARLADVIEESCPRAGLPDALKGYERGQEILEMNVTFVGSGLMQLSTLQARARQCQSVYEYYGGILNQRMSN